MENFSVLHNTCLQVFQAVAQTSFIFLLPLFMTKIVFSNLMGDGSKVFSALKGAVIYFCLIAAFPLIIEILFSIPDAYLPKYESLGSMTGHAPDWGSSLIPYSLDRVLEVILAGLYWIVYYLHVFFMLVMCSMAPIVFLSSSLLGVGLGLEIFMGLLIVGSSWPIIWYGFDQVHSSLVTAQTDEFGAKCLELLLTLFKGIAPLAFASLAVKSPPGKAIAGAAKASMMGGKLIALKMVTAPLARMSPNPNQRYQGGKFSNLQNGNKNSFGNTSGAKSKAFSGSSHDRLAKAKVQSNSQKGEKPNENSRPRDIQA